MKWLVVMLKTYTDDVAEYVAEYSNRGHAIARYRGLCRRAWLARSEVRYAIRRG